jgi:hypothetical protein
MIVFTCRRLRNGLKDFGLDMIVFTESQDGQVSNERRIIFKDLH